tara:strand:+ start:470 stop:820 length:351 start_codon:yes stop_codon:yes gene_type:complete
MDEKPVVTQASVVEAMGAINDPYGVDPEDRKFAQEILKNATPDQIDHARAMQRDKEADRESYGGEKSTGTYGKAYAAGGIVDELGYMHGGVPHGERDPIKYAAGGAVRGKRFVGSF